MKFRAINYTIVFSVLILGTLGLSYDAFAHQTSSYHGPYSDDDDSVAGPVQDKPNWMKDIDSDTLLTQVNLPGSHDTMSDCRDDTIRHTFFTGPRPTAAYDAKETEFKNLGYDVDEIYDDPFQDDWRGEYSSGMTCDGPLDYADSSADVLVEDDVVITATKTQIMTLPSQLESGIRFLDIRIAITDDTLILRCPDSIPTGGCNIPIYHGGQFQGSFFDTDVLPVVLEFLDNNPSETIVMRLGNEANEQIQ
ncbi:MAG: hypothetical protein ACE5RG_06425, partial [Candidatus Nitrosomaritimum yanchengensis]